MVRDRRGMTGQLCAFALTVAVVLLLFTAPAFALGRWVTGDSHTHTTQSDGRHTLPEVLYQAFGIWGLDWIASTDHGYEMDANVLGEKYTADTVGNGSGDIWFWDASLDNWKYFDAQRAEWPGKVLFQGYEWGVPGREESKTVFMADQTRATAPTYETGLFVSDFEYLFDTWDSSIGQTRTLGGYPSFADPAQWGTTETRTGLVKDPELYDKAPWGIAAAEYLRDVRSGAQPSGQSDCYSILSHPSRSLAWSVGDIRRFNDTDPDVFIGMCGIPGAQRNDGLRSWYRKTWYRDDGTVDEAKTALARTYGGADLMTAKVGGVWDALLAEGRSYWIFSDSDFHSALIWDFWPGQYSRDHMWAEPTGPDGTLTPADVFATLRSGNSFSVMGQLIDGLDFRVADRSGNSATMGQTLDVAKGTSLTVTVKWHSPALNNWGDVPKVDHVDLIAGLVTGRISPDDPAYDMQATNPSAKVAKRWTTASLKASKAGWYTATYSIKASGDLYFRLRGTNLGLSVPNQTDASGNPLSDALIHNDAEQAWADLWFYSNPVFVNVR